jgi:hypothetical protein
MELGAFIRRQNRSLVRFRAVTNLWKYNMIQFLSEEWMHGRGRWVPVEVSGRRE